MGFDNTELDRKQPTIPRMQKYHQTGICRLGNQLLYSDLVRRIAAKRVYIAFSKVRWIAEVRRVRSPPTFHALTHSLTPLGRQS